MAQQAQHTELLQPATVLRQMHTLHVTNAAHERSLANLEERLQGAIDEQGAQLRRVRQLTDHAVTHGASTAAEAAFLRTLRSMLDNFDREDALARVPVR